MLEAACLLANLTNAREPRAIFERIGGLECAGSVPRHAISCRHLNLSQSRHVIPHAMPSHPVSIAPYHPCIHSMIPSHPISIAHVISAQKRMRTARASMPMPTPSRVSVVTVQSSQGAGPGQPLADVRDTRVIFEAERPSDRLPHAVSPLRPGRLHGSRAVLIPCLSTGCASRSSSPVLPHVVSACRCRRQLIARPASQLSCLAPLTPPSSASLMRTKLPPPRQRLPQPTMRPLQRRQWRCPTRHPGSRPPRPPRRRCTPRECRHPTEATSFVQKRASARPTDQSTTGANTFMGVCLAMCPTLGGLAVCPNTWALVKREVIGGCGAQRRWRLCAVWVDAS